MPLGDAARRAVHELVDTLVADPRVPAAGRLRWAVTENLHLTMRFLGPTAPARVPEVIAAAEAAVAGVDPIEVRLAGAGAFPSPDRPRVMWLGIDRGAPELAHLAARLDRERWEQETAEGDAREQPDGR